LFRVYNNDGKLIAIMVVDTAARLLRPRKVLAAEDVRESSL
jgi:hypothetical protein